MKNKIFLILSIIFLLITITIIPKDKKKENITINEEETIINNILANINDKSINKDYLEWIINKYSINTLRLLNDSITNNTYNKNTWHEITGNSYLVLNDLYNHKYEESNNLKIIDTKGDITISFVGDISLADNWYIMPKYKERNKGIYGILSEDIVKIMTETDIMVANNEFTISNRGEKLKGKAYTFRANPSNLSIYNEMGIDLLTLANNHIYDFGELAFNDTIDSLNEYNIPYIGAGKNMSEAKRPYYFIINGYKIGFVNATRAEKHIMTPEATDTKGGVIRCYDPEIFKNTITETKLESDYVIALIHWGKEDSHNLEQVQKDTSKIYIDAGADVIIGSHAHVLQGIEFYKNKPIIYNLGDFIFNSENKDTGIFQIKLNNNGTMDYIFIPAKQKDEYTKLLYDNEKINVINNMNKWSINTIIDNNGIIKEKN